MHDCEYFEQRYTDWQQGRLSEDEEAKLSQHSAVCAHCGAITPEIARLRENLLTLPEISPPVGFEFRLKRRIEEAGNGKAIKSPRKGMMPAWTAMGAGFATGVAVAIALLIPSGVGDSDFSPRMSSLDPGVAEISSPEFATSENGVLPDSIRDSSAVSESPYSIDRHSQVVSGVK